MNIHPALKQINKIAKSNGGKCLSTIYINSKTKLEWQCRFGHRWFAAKESIVSGHWCPECAGNKRKSITDLHRVAATRGGKCLSSEYFGKNEKYKWQCQSGHTWEATFGSVDNNGSWCKKCDIERRRGLSKYTIVDAQNIAKTFSGRCLSDKFSNASQILKWECKYGHIFDQKLTNVRLGVWCSECKKGYVGEKIVRAYFEASFKVQFPKTRPEWLRFKEKKLELDGYNSTLQLAFEHHGDHHYRISRYSPTKSKLNLRKKMDSIKKKICENHGVKLVIVPEVPRLLPIEDLPYFLQDSLKKMGLSIRVTPIDVGAAIYGNEKEKYLNRVRRIVQERGGKLLSSNVVNAKEKLKFECDNKHIFMMSSDKMLRGQWCGLCKKHTISKIYAEKWKSNGNTLSALKNHAQLKGGNCRSKEFTKPNEKYEWQCSEGHKWFAEWSRVRKGVWCRFCANKAITEKLKIPIEEFARIAKKRGGKLLSREYNGAKSKLKFVCKRGHKFESYAANISKGHWCRFCGYLRKKNS